VGEKHGLHVFGWDSGRGEKGTKKGTKKRCLDWSMAYAMGDENTWGWENPYSIVLC
jgi:hypothetical protein